MSDELNRLRKYVRDMRNNVTSDTEVICAGGEVTHLSSMLITARSKMFAAMLKGGFKESASKTVKFPTYRVDTVERAIIFLQNADFKAPPTAEDLFEDLKFANMYELEEYVHELNNHAKIWCDLPHLAPKIYALYYRDHQFKTIKNLAFETIVTCLKTHVKKYVCERCGHPMKIFDITCGSDFCKGKRIQSTIQMGFEQIDDEIRLKIFNKYLKTIGDVNKKNNT